MSVPAGPKGTRDFYPADMAFQNYLFTSWKKTCRRYSFEEYDGPMFEHLAVYTQKSGDEIEKQLYTFEDKGGRRMALRPEMTPSLARMVAAKGPALKKPARWYSIARLFRYEKMQKGRLREFHQLNMDILGSSEITADAELIAAVVDMMRDLGLSSNDFQVRISSRTLLDELLKTLQLEIDSFKPIYALLDKKNKISEKHYEEELSTIIGDSEKRSQITKILSAPGLEYLKEHFGETPTQKELCRLFGFLDKYGMKDYVRFDIGIVRGLAYYTGTVFEVFDINKGMRAIAGGGRYDKLVGLYGGPATPAVGFAAGDVVLADLIREKGLTPPASSRCQVFLVAFDDDGYDEAIPTAQQFRNSGISCEFPLKRIGIGKQLKQADATGAAVTVFLGGNEASERKCKIKYMADGREEILPADQMLKIVKKYLDELLQERV